jgi:hypothetical protein
MSWQEVVFVDQGCKFILCLKNISYTYFVFFDTVVDRTVIIINTFSVVETGFGGEQKVLFNYIIET